jgi:hypothetical protein
MPSRKSDARRSDVSVARFVLADEDSAMATESPAPEPPAAEPAAEPSASSSTPGPQQQPGDKKDKEKEKEKEREREREREKERDAITIEVCTSRTHRQTARKTNTAHDGRT